MDITTRQKESNESTLEQRRIELLLEDRLLPDGDILLSAGEVAEMLRVSESWLARCRTKHKATEGPPFIKVGGSVRYRQSALMRYLEENTHGGTGNAQKG